jgi:endonuclease-8
VAEGDTIFRTAAVLRGALVGETVTAARARSGGAQVGRLVGAKVTSVTARGKHLLIDFDDGLTLHSHLGLTGAWHRYAPGEPWRRPASRVLGLLETDRHVVVCFDAPVLELVEHRALALHPWLAGLGPDLLDEPPDLDGVVARLRVERRAQMSIGEALLDQRVVAGLGNVYRSEILAHRLVSPFLPVHALSDATLIGLLELGRDLLRANVTGGDRVTMPDSLGAAPWASAGLRRQTRRWVYGRAGQPCRRCGTMIRSQPLGHPARRVYWCPRCQVGPSSAGDSA